MKKVKSTMLTFAAVVLAAGLLAGCGESKEEKVERLSKSCALEMAKSPMSTNHASCNELAKLK